MRHPRGITLMTVLIFLALAGGVYCLFAFGQAYWENFEVKGILRQAANECYRQPDDAQVKQFISNKLHSTFDVVGEDKFGRRESRMPIMFDEGEVQIQRTEVPKTARDILTALKIDVPRKNCCMELFNRACQGNHVGKA